MSDVQAEFGHLEVIFHNDDKTPLEFVIELLHSVFNKQMVDAVRFAEAINNHGQASCGTYPRDIGSDLLEAGRATHPRRGASTPDHRQGGHGRR